MPPFTQRPLTRPATAARWVHDKRRRHGRAERHTRVGGRVDELRTILRAFDEVAPAEMDEHFYIHAYNELDLAGRTIIHAFDRERRGTDDRQVE